MHGEGNSMDVNGRQSGRRGNKGRSRLSSIDDVELNLRNLGVRRRGTITLDRAKRAQVVRAAGGKVHGLCAK
jgi:hypothetical protein